MKNLAPINDEQDKVTKKYVDDAVAAINLANNPIGTLYMNRTLSAAPNTFMPGLEGTTWQPVEDRLLMAAGPSYQVNTIGGSLTHSHFLSEKGHASVIIGGTGASGKFIPTQAWTATRRVGSSGSTISSTNTVGTPLDGETDENNYLPPFFTAYVWERTA